MYASELQSADDRSVASQKTPALQQHYDWLKLSYERPRRPLLSLDLADPKESAEFKLMTDLVNATLKEDRSTVCARANLLMKYAEKTQALSMRCPVPQLRDLLRDQRLQIILRLLDLKVDFKMWDQMLEPFQPIFDDYPTLYTAILSQDWDDRFAYIFATKLVVRNHLSIQILSSFGEGNPLRLDPSSKLALTYVATGVPFRTMFAKCVQKLDAQENVIVASNDLIKLDFINKIFPADALSLHPDCSRNIFRICLRLFVENQIIKALKKSANLESLNLTQTQVEEKNRIFLNLVQKAGAVSLKRIANEAQPYEKDTKSYKYEEFLILVMQALLPHKEDLFEEERELWPLMFLMHLPESKSAATSHVKQHYQVLSKFMQPNSPALLAVKMLFLHKEGEKSLFARQLIDIARDNPDIKKKLGRKYIDYLIATAHMALADDLLMHEVFKKVNIKNRYDVVGDDSVRKILQDVQRNLRVYSCLMKHDYEYLLYFSSSYIILRDYQGLKLFFDTYRDELKKHPFGLFILDYASNFILNDFRQTKDLEAFINDFNILSVLNKRNPALTQAYVTSPKFRRKRLKCLSPAVIHALKAQQAELKQQREAKVQALTELPTENSTASSSSTVSAAESTGSSAESLGPQWHDAPSIYDLSSGAREYKAKKTSQNKKAKQKDKAPEVNAPTPSNTLNEEVAFNVLPRRTEVVDALNKDQKSILNRFFIPMLKPDGKTSDKKANIRFRDLQKLLVALAQDGTSQRGSHVKATLPGLSEETSDLLQQLNAMIVIPEREVVSPVYVRQLREKFLALGFYTQEVADLMENDDSDDEGAVPVSSESSSSSIH